MAMRMGIQVQITWCGDDRNEIKVSASNGIFQGAAHIFIGIGALKEAAERLHRFPESPTDNREIIFGQFELSQIASGVNMRFYCIDGVGGCVDVKMQADYRRFNWTGGFEIQAVTLSMRIEAAAVDVFVKKLLKMEAKRAGRAHLKALQ